MISLIRRFVEYGSTKLWIILMNLIFLLDAHLKMYDEVIVAKTKGPVSLWLFTEGVIPISGISLCFSHAFRITNNFSLRNIAQGISWRNVIRISKISKAHKTNLLSRVCYIKNYKIFSSLENSKGSYNIVILNYCRKMLFTSSD